MQQHANTLFLVGLCLLVPSLVCALTDDVVDLRNATLACSAESRPFVLTDPSGTFTSENYPGNYNSNSECGWLLVAQPGQIIHLSFDAFSAEDDFDFLWVHDGNTDLSPVIIGLTDAKFGIVDNIYSSGESLYVQFLSDGIVEQSGFSASYESIDPASANPDPCMALTRPFVLNSYQGTLTSKYYPAYYPLQCECQWLIESQEADGFVRLDFTEFVTEANRDWVVIYDGDSTAGPLLGRLSGSYTPAPTGFQTSQRYMFIRFGSDAYYTLPGFRATYTSIPAA
jgi:hypothetical protein